MSDWISIIVFPLIAVKEKKIKRVAALLCKGLQGCYPALWQVCHEAVHLKNLICTQVHKQPASNRSCPGSPRSPPESPLLLNGFCLAVHELDIIMKSKRKRCFSLSLSTSLSLYSLVFYTREQKKHLLNNDTTICLKGFSGITAAVYHAITRECWHAYVYVLLHIQWRHLCLCVCTLNIYSSAFWEEENGSLKNKNLIFIVHKTSTST